MHLTLLKKRKNSFVFYYNFCNRWWYFRFDQESRYWFRCCCENAAFALVKMMTWQFKHVCYVDRALSRRAEWIFALIITTSQTQVSKTQRCDSDNRDCITLASLRNCSILHDAKIVPFVSAQIHTGAQVGNQITEIKTK